MPAPASTFGAMAVGTILLFRRGLGWKDLGLRWPESWMKTAGLTVLTIFLFIVAVKTMELLAGYFFESVGASGRFDYVEGNFAAYIGTMFLVWAHTSFFEELLFPAFVVSRASHFLGGGLKADLIAVVFSSIFFGYPNGPSAERFRSPPGTDEGYVVGDGKFRN